MVFSSIPFLFYFLPFVMVSHFLLPKKLRNLCLFLASIVFYAWGEQKNIWIMCMIVLAGYVWGGLIEQAKENRRRKIYLMLSSVFILSFLIYYKYIDFLIRSINSVLGASITPLGVVLPIGISFYTFQVLSYLIDIYRGDVKAQRSFIDFAAYVVLFPQLIAGPIVRYVDIAKQLVVRSCSVEKSYLGARRFLFGLSKKVLLADQFGALCDVFLNMQDKTVLFYWMYAIGFTLQIYFDFSGYSDMAIGLGNIFGFTFLENFNYPYVSESITEFWRRWHMSLGFWFRDYVYIPLGGNRVSKWKWFRNIFVVWMLTGLWHGASWNFIWWGLLFGTVLVIEKLWLHKVLKKIPRGFRHVYVMFIVIISFVIFQATDMTTALQDIAGMFGLQGVAMTNTETNYYLSSYAFTLLQGVIGCTPLPKMIVNYIRKGKLEQGVNEGSSKSLEGISNYVISILEPIVLCVLLLLITARLVDGSFQPFLYFRF